MRYKSFCIGLVGFLLAFLLANYVVWIKFTEELLTDKYDGGDIVRVGVIYGSKMPRKNCVDLPRQHIEMSDYTGQKIDVMTIGDSFSAGGGEGKNHYYQDYIATNYNFNVLNVGPYPTDDRFMFFAPMSTLAVLYNSGYLDIIKPRYILIESIVRYCIPRYAKPFNFAKTDSLEHVKEFYAIKSQPGKLPKISFMNNGNLKFLTHNFLYMLSDTAFGNKIYVEKLDRPLFSVKKPNNLPMMQEDIRSIGIINSQTVASLNDNFNKVADLLAKKGIKLIFMPIPDKYDLYSDYIVNNHYPRNPFFEELRKLPKRYMFIDTKALLTEELKKGEKDLYYADDTHWSWKAPEKIFSKVRIE